MAGVSVTVTAYDRARREPVRVPPHSPLTRLLVTTILVTEHLSRGGGYVPAPRSCRGAHPGSDRRSPCKRAGKGHPSTRDAASPRHPGGAAGPRLAARRSRPSADGAPRESFRVTPPRRPRRKPAPEPRPRQIVTDA